MKTRRGGDGGEAESREGQKNFLRVCVFSVFFFCLLSRYEGLRYSADTDACLLSDTRRYAAQCVPLCCPASLFVYDVACFFSVCSVVALYFSSVLTNCTTTRTHIPIRMCSAAQQATHLSPRKRKKNENNTHRKTETARARRLAVHSGRLANCSQRKWLPAW